VLLDRLEEDPGDAEDAVVVVGTDREQGRHRGSVSGSVRGGVGRSCDLTAAPLRGK
jgi:hypothetical protein